MNSKRKPATWWAFWISIGTIIYTYVGFHLLVALRAWLRPQPIWKGTAGSEFVPTVSVIIAAYNEAAVIGQKIENCLSLDYPPEKLEIIIASDGSDDGTEDIVRRYQSERVRLLALPRMGKNRVLNQTIGVAMGDVLVFSDADSMFLPASIRRLVAPFADPEVGGVSGNYFYAGGKSGAQGERTYWDYDRQLKQMQSLGGSVTSATGQIYAIRREMFTPVPAGVTDDAFISRSVVARHNRLVFEPSAIATGPIAKASREVHRKIRVSTRGLKAVWEQRSLLNPLDYGFYSLQLLTHKVLRRLVAIPLALTAISAPFLWSRGLFYRFAAIGQLGLHAAAGLGHALQGTPAGRNKLLSFPYHFDMVNLAGLIGLINLLRGERYDRWEAERAEIPQVEPGDTVTTIEQAQGVHL